MVQHASLLCTELNNLIRTQWTVELDYEYPCWIPRDVSTRYQYWWDNNIPASHVKSSGCTTTTGTDRVQDGSPQSRVFLASYSAWHWTVTRLHQPTPTMPPVTS